MLEPIHQIQKVLETYQKGYLEALPELIASTFHSEVKLLCADSGQLESTSMKDWLTSIQARKEKKEVREGKLTVKSIEVQGPLAFAQTHFEIKIGSDQVVFTEFLSLLLVAEQWVIVGKIYQAKKVNSV